MKSYSFIIICLFSIKGFSQTQENQLVGEIRNDYYKIQKNLPSLVKLNDSVNYYIVDQSVVKITAKRKQESVEYFFNKNFMWPFFVFSTNNKKEDRYYFEVYESLFNRIRMIRWLDENKKNVSSDSAIFKEKEWLYLMTGRKLMILVSNDILLKKHKQKRQVVIDSLIRASENIDLDNFIILNESSEVDHQSSSSSGVEKYISKDEQISCELDYSNMDCAGGVWQKTITCAWKDGQKISIHHFQNGNPGIFDEYISWGIINKSIEYCSEAGCFKIERSELSSHYDRKYEFPYKIIEIK